MIFQSSFTHLAENPHIPGADLSGLCLRDSSKSLRDSWPSSRDFSIVVSVGYFWSFSSRYAGYRGGGRSSSVSPVNCLIDLILSLHVWVLNNVE